MSTQISPVGMTLLPSVMDVQNHETLAYRQIWYETQLLAHSCLQ